jgi:serine/threonine protein kinase
MVTGTMPFDAANDILLSEQIRKGKFNIPSNVSSSCASLISGLLQRDPSKRLSAAEALTHPWFVPRPSSYPASSSDIERLNHYLKLDRVQKFVVAYLVAHTADSELVEESDCFMRINKSKTGVLSKEEVDEWMGERNIREVFEEINIGRTKEISYLGTFTQLTIDFVAAFLPEHIARDNVVLNEALEFIQKVTHLQTLRIKEMISG